MKHSLSTRRSLDPSSGARQHPFSDPALHPYCCLLINLALFPWSPDCFVDVVVGFDISTHHEGQPLFQGHPRLESHLPSILEDITSIRGVSCGAGAEAQVNLAFKVNNDQEFPAKFQIYQKAVFDDLLQVTVRGPSHLNAQFLQSLWDVFEEQSASRGQVFSLQPTSNSSPHICSPFPVTPLASPSSHSPPPLSVGDAYFLRRPPGRKHHLAGAAVGQAQRSRY